MTFKIHNVDGQENILRNSSFSVKPQSKVLSSDHVAIRQQLEKIESNKRSDRAKKTRANIEQEIKEVTKRLETIEPFFNHELKYVVDFKSHNIMVKIIDAKSNEVIKEIPAAPVRRLRERIQEFIGLLVDKQA